VIDIRAVFVRYPESAIVVQHKAFTVQRDALAEHCLITTAKSVTRIRGDGQVREARIREMTTSIRVERGTRRTIGTVKQNGLKICKDQIRARGIGYRSIWFGGEVNIKLVDTWLDVESALRIPELGD
jgi:hypothetical protein